MWRHPVSFASGHIALKVMFYLLIIYLLMRISNLKYYDFKSNTRAIKETCLLDATHNQLLICHTDYSISS